MGSDIIVEVRGGCLVGIYCSDPEQRFILLDWDDLNELPEEQRLGSVFHADALAQMPQDTRRAYDRSLSSEQGLVR